MKKIPDKIMVITVTDSRSYPDHFWREPLEKNCQKLIWVDLKKIYFENGKIKTHKTILDLFKLERPDYLFMFDSLYYDLDIPLLLTSLKNISSKTKSVFWSGDDDLKFDSVRYLGLFFDYLFVAQNDFVPSYKKDGLKNVIFITQTKREKKENLKKDKKEYDVSFIGTPKSDRNEILEFLIDNGIKIKVFGYSWDKYPKIKPFYGGVLSSEDYIKTISKTKINICLSKNAFDVPHMKGRFLEISHCRSFSLVENSPQLAELFKEGKEIIFFKDKEDMLDKIKHYLKRETEREEIAARTYKKVIAKFDFEKKISNFIKKTNKKTSSKNLPELNYSIINLNENFINLSKEDVSNRIKNYEYVSFSKGIIKKSKFKDYLQIYSIKKNKKPISCCDYFIYSKSLGDFAQFRYCPFGLQPNKNIIPYLNINQIVLTKDFFLKNFDVIKEDYQSEVLNFVNRENTSFVSLPLVSISKFREMFFNSNEFSNELGLFLFSGHRELYSKRKNLLKFSFYLLSLIKEILNGKRFISNQLKIKIKGR